jgi:hypothetical protein
MAGFGFAELRFAPVRRYATQLLLLPQDKLVITVAPGHAQLHAIEILHRDKLLPSR